MKLEGNVQFTFKDKPVQCQVCEGETFSVREAQLNTPMATLLGFDWANKTASCLVCVDCDSIQWFYSLDKLKQGATA